MKNVALLAYIMFVVDNVVSSVHWRTMMMIMTSTVKQLFSVAMTSFLFIMKTVTILELPD